MIQFCELHKNAHWLLLEKVYISMTTTFRQQQRQWHFSMHLLGMILWRLTVLTLCFNFECLSVKSQWNQYNIQLKVTVQCLTHSIHCVNANVNETHSQWFIEDTVVSRARTPLIQPEFKCHLWAIHWIEIVRAEIGIAYKLLNDATAFFFHSLTSFKSTYSNELMGCYVEECCCCHSRTYNYFHWISSTIPFICF